MVEEYAAFIRGLTVEDAVDLEIDPIEPMIWPSEIDRHRR
jgi:hypothetical protein